MQLELLVLSHGLPEAVVWALVLYSAADVVASQSHRVECLQAKSLLHNLTSLDQTEVAHALEGLNVDKPVHLLSAQHLLPAYSFVFAEHEALRSPSSHDIELG